MEAKLVEKFLDGLFETGNYVVTETDCEERSGRHASTSLVMKLQPWDCPARVPNDFLPCLSHIYPRPSPQMVPSPSLSYMMSQK